MIVYSPHGKDLLTEFEARYEQLHPEVNVQWLDMGSQSILDRLRSEQANPQADVWFGAPSALFETAAAEGLLERFVPTWAGELPEYARAANGTWHGTYVTPEVIAYNSNAVSAADAPKDWDDVLDPKWKGKVLIRDPLESGTMRTIFGMILYRSLRTTGDTAAGFDWLRRLNAQTKEYVLNPTMLYNKLGRQEGLITLWDMPDIEIVMARTELPLNYVIPRSGTPFPSMELPWSRAVGTLPARGPSSNLQVARPASCSPRDNSCVCPPAPTSRRTHCPSACVRP